MTVPSSTSTDDQSKPAELDNHQTVCEWSPSAIHLSNGSRESHNSETESEEAYRLRVYGNETSWQQSLPSFGRQQSLRRLSQRLSTAVMQRRSSFIESLPETPQGWAVLLSVLASVVLGYEIQLQEHLTCPPLVYGQVPGSGPLQDVYEKMTHTGDSILSRTIQPSLFVGTRGLMSSMAAYFLGGPSTSGDDEPLTFRELMTMTHDGANIALDWELPILNNNQSMTADQRKQQILQGPIEQPVVLIMHGINNHAKFGYMRSLMRACSKRGWIAAGMNFRGCTVPMSTPRGYNGAFTGDIRCTVHRLSARLGPGVPLFLVGNSLSANLLTKYLGEEGLSGTLPACVAGGVALGTPLVMQSGKIDRWVSPIMALGAKRMLIENWRALRYMNNREFRTMLRKALLAVTLADFDNAYAPSMVRNDPIYPFGVSIGYENGESYWREASSYRYVRHISVPTMQVVAGDDFLIYHPFRERLRFCTTNPNVIVVETKCGGHLGWQESPPDASRFQLGSSWSDVATTEFIAAVLDQREVQGNVTTSSDVDGPFDFAIGRAIRQNEALEQAKTLRSRL